MLKANFNAYGSYVTDSLYQWDLNQVLQVTGLGLTVAPEVHFANAAMDRAIPKQATLDENGVVSVDVPNTVLQHPLRIYAYIGIYEGDTFKVVETVEIPVIPKKRPTDYVFEDTDGEIYSYNNLENQIANIRDTWIETHENQVENSVTAWLTAHPEATTTVQDHSLTIDKMVIGELGYVTPQMFGAVGDGVTDDTEAIQTALNSFKRIVFENGVFLVSDTLNVESDTIIEMKNAEIVSTVTDEKKYVFLIEGKTNVKILADNSSLTMSKPNTAQQACVAIFNSTNVYVSGLILSGAGGDGVIVGGTNEETVSNVEIVGCTIDNSRRNGVSLVGGIDGFSIHGCVIKNTSGTSPQLGIDVETWNAEYANKNISIFDNRFENNTNGALTFFEYTDGVKVYDNHFDNIVSVKINTDYNGVVEANPTNISFYNNIFEASLYFYGIDYGGYNIQGNIFDGGKISIESPVNVSADDMKNAQSRLIKGNTFNRSSAALIIGYCANMIICDNVVNDCGKFITAWSFYKSVIKGNLINGYNVSGDVSRIFEFSGKIEGIIIENNVIISNINTTSTNHVVYYSGGSTFGNVCRNNNFANALFTTPVGYDAQNDNIDYGNATPTCDNFCFGLPAASKKFAGMIVSVVGETSVYTYVCTVADGAYVWKQLNFTT